MFKLKKGPCGRKAGSKVGCAGLCCVTLGVAGAAFPRITSLSSSRLKLSKMSLSENWKAEGRSHYLSLLEPWDSETDA